MPVLEANDNMDEREKMSRNEIGCFNTSLVSRSRTEDLCAKRTQFLQKNRQNERDLG